MEAALFAFVFHQWGLGWILVSTPYVLHIRSEKLHSGNPVFRSHQSHPVKSEKEKEERKNKLGMNSESY